jgi:formate hydrogenlyase subunit 3/multisubunit Na+/H+ antiporter MnhD subunit
MNSMILVILIPVFAALLGFVFYRLRNEFSFIGTVLTLYMAFRIFLATRTNIIGYDLFNIFGINLSLYADAFTGFLLLALAFFGLCLVLYSFRYIRSLMPKQQNLYHFYLIATLAGANGLVLAKNLFLILLFLGFLVLTSYGMLMLSKIDTKRGARKVLFIVSIPYLIMVLGTILLHRQTGLNDIIAVHKISLNEPINLIIFILLLIGILAKIGVIPFHYWIPTVAPELPASTFACVPVITNNLLGIYLFTRISLFLFDLASSPVMMYVLMAIGALTILIAVIIALRQTNLIRRLSFFSISQVGYIILGIGTAMPVAVAGGLFHMINNVIILSALVLAAGSVVFRTKTQELNNLGGLATKMPVTFIAFLVTALAISGIPPLNGFFSQWMIFQGLLSLNNIGSFIFLIIAVLGSILTLMAFLRITQSIFLGSRPHQFDRTIEVGFSMNLVPIMLAILCIIFGIFAQKVPLNLFVLPSLMPIIPFTPTANFWTPTFITILMIAWVVVGILIYLFITVLKPKPSLVFTGGEEPNSQNDSNADLHSFSPIQLQFLDLKSRIYYNINKIFPGVLAKKRGLKKIRSEG